MEKYPGTKKIVSGVISVIAVIWMFQSFVCIEPETQEYLGSPKTIVMGTISTTLSQSSRQYSNLVNYLKRVFINQTLDFDLIVADSKEHLMSLFEKGKLDIYVDHAMNIQGVNPWVQFHSCLMQEPLDRENNRAVIAVRGNSDFQTLDDLNGAKIAFRDQNSELAYQVTKSDFLEKGIPLFNIKNKYLSSKQIKGAVFYRIVSDATEAIDLLFSQHLAAVALTADEYQGLNEEHKDKLRLIHQSDLIPASQLCYHKSLPLRLVSQLNIVLKEMSGNLLGRQVLFTLNKSSKFESISPNDSDLYESLKQRIYLLEESQEIESNIDSLSMALP